mmetsp:Transcript_1301/g.4396  ORF Transcript_1301/g.4396 Transcript_1301/m.4396 type:complete len:220 (-) Transcript_1301:222-881(-)
MLALPPHRWPWSLIQGIFSILASPPDAWPNARSSTCFSAGIPAFSQAIPNIFAWRCQPGSRSRSSSTSSSSRRPWWRKWEKGAPHWWWHAWSPQRHALWHSVFFQRPAHLKAMWKSGFGHPWWHLMSPGLQVLWHSNAAATLACIRGHCGVGHLAWQSMLCPQNLWHIMMGFIFSHFFARCTQGFGHRSWQSLSAPHFQWHSFTIPLMSSCMPWCIPRS